MSARTADETKVVLQKAAAGGRVTYREAVTLLEYASLPELAETAHAIARARHPEPRATFCIDRNINYTNICRSKCAFCAFYREADDPDAYLLANEEVYAKTEEALELGATHVMLQGGLHPDLSIDYYEDLVRSIKRRFAVQVHSFSPPEVCHIAQVSGLETTAVLARLKEAGLDSLPGGGAEILVDEIRRKVSPEKISSGEWLRVMEEAHGLGLPTTATMMMGTVETCADRVAHLARLRELQDRTGGFVAFIPWTIQPGNTELGGEPVSSYEYLRLLALARIFLDNFDNLQGSWVTQGKAIGQLSLEYGGNDLGSIMIEENVVRAAGVTYKMELKEIVRLIKATGRRAAQRDACYRPVKEY